MQRPSLPTRSVEDLCLQYAFGAGPCPDEEQEAAPPDPDALLSGFKSLLGDLYIDASRLEFVAELGVGELALVERAQYYAAAGRPTNVVVKGYSPHVVATPEDLRALLAEARNIQRLHHRHIVRLIGLGCFHHQTPEDLRGSLFMVEEFVGTMSLKSLLRLQKRTRWRWLYSMPTAVRWAVSLASALAALHSAEPPYVHGDVKAINVFLTDAITLDAATVKLGDLKPHRHVYDKSPSLMSEHQEATLALEQQSLRKAALKDRSKKAAAKWQGSKPLGRKSVEIARAEWDSHTANSSDSGSYRMSFDRRSLDAVSSASTPRASAAAAAAAAAALILTVPEHGAAGEAPLRAAGPLAARPRGDEAAGEQRGGAAARAGAEQRRQAGEAGPRPEHEEQGQARAQGKQQQEEEGQGRQPAAQEAGPKPSRLQPQPQRAAAAPPPAAAAAAAGLGPGPNGAQANGAAATAAAATAKTAFEAQMFAGTSTDRTPPPEMGRLPSYIIQPGCSRQHGVGSQQPSAAGAAPAAATSGGLPEPAAGGGAAPATAAAASNAGSVAGAPEGLRVKSILQRSSSVAADGGRLLARNKSVRFEMARAEGVTSNRDWGLLYASPELLRKRELTTKADVFAFGVLLYELLTRRLVTWNDDSAQAQAYERSVRGGRINVKRHGDESIQLLAYAERVADGYRPPIPDHWPEQAIALVEGCWAAEPSERPAMEAVQQTLAALMKDRRLLRQLEAEQPPAAPEGNTCACTIC